MMFGFGSEKAMMFLLLLCVVSLLASGEAGGMWREREPGRVRLEDLGLESGDLSAFSRLREADFLSGLLKREAAAIDVRDSRGELLEEDDLTPARVRDLLERRGASFVVRFEEFRSVSDEVAEAARSLGTRAAEAFLAPVSVHAYLTGAGGRALPAHTDTKDVVVVQVLGAKRWKYCDPAPVANETSLSAAARAELAELKIGSKGCSQYRQVEDACAVNFILDEPKEALFLPKGTIHEARADDFSLHLTLGIDRITWLDVFQAALRVDDDYSKKHGDFRVKKKAKNLGRALRRFREGPQAFAASEPKAATAFFAAFPTETLEVSSSSSGTHRLNKIADSPLSRVFRKKFFSSSLLDLQLPPSGDLQAHFDDLCDAIYRLAAYAGPPAGACARLYASFPATLQDHVSFASSRQFFEAKTPALAWLASTLAPAPLCSSHSRRTLQATTDAPTPSPTATFSPTPFCKDNKKKVCVDGCDEGNTPCSSGSSCDSSCTGSGSQRRCDDSCDSNCPQSSCDDNCSCEKKNTVSAAVAIVIIVFVFILLPICCVSGIVVCCVVALQKNNQRVRPPMGNAVGPHQQMHQGIAMQPIQQQGMQPGAMMTPPQQYAQGPVVMAQQQPVYATAAVLPQENYGQPPQALASSWNQSAAGGGPVAQAVRVEVSNGPITQYQYR